MVGKNFDIGLFKQIMKIKDEFSTKRFREKMTLVKTRFGFSKELILLRDKVAIKRHGERLQLLYKKKSGLLARLRGRR